MAKATSSSKLKFQNIETRHLAKGDSPSLTPPKIVEFVRRKSGITHRPLPERRNQERIAPGLPLREHIKQRSYYSYYCSRVEIITSILFLFHFHDWSHLRCVRMEARNADSLRENFLDADFLFILSNTCICSGMSS